MGSAHNSLGGGSGGEVGMGLSPGEGRFLWEAAVDKESGPRRWCVKAA